MVLVSVADEAVLGYWNCLIGCCGSFMSSSDCLVVDVAAISVLGLVSVAVGTTSWALGPFLWVVDLVVAALVVLGFSQWLMEQFCGLYGLSHWFLWQLWWFLE